MLTSINNAMVNNENVTKIQKYCILHTETLYIFLLKFVGMVSSII